MLTTVEVGDRTSLDDRVSHPGSLLWVLWTAAETQRLESVHECCLSFCCQHTKNTLTAF